MSDGREADEVARAARAIRRVNLSTSNRHGERRPNVGR